MSDVVTLPDAPEGLKLTRDHAIAAMAIRTDCSLQQAADALAKITATADAAIKAATDEAIKAALG